MVIVVAVGFYFNRRRQNKKELEEDKAFNL